MFTTSTIKHSFISSSFVALVTGALITLSGCAADSADHEDVHHEESADQRGWVVPPVMVDEKSNDTTVNVAAGQPLMITLQGNATTGYTWSVTSNGLTTEPSTHYAPASDAPGAGGSTAFTWESTKDLAPGRYPLTLAYSRSWESGRPARTFSIVVEIAH